MILEVYRAICDKKQTVDSIKDYLKMHKIDMNKREIKTHIKTLINFKIVSSDMKIIFEIK